MRTRVYHKSLEGKIVTSEEELKQALSEGWVEAPWLVDEVKKPEDPYHFDYPGEDAKIEREAKHIKKPGRTKVNGKR